LTNVIRRQEIKYKVYSSDGVLVKEMHRFVTVVDTEAPTFVEIKDKTYYVGVNYTVDDFVSEYSDNYDKKYLIAVSEKNFVFTREGMHGVEIVFKDSSENSTVYTTNIYAILDIEKLLYEVYKDQPYMVTSGETGNGSRYTKVRIDSQKSFSYYDSGSLHYLETVTTDLGTSASIQISSKHEEFDNADISFHISGIGDSYSVGFATIYATMQSVNIDDFRSTINGLNLEADEMLLELNQNINSALANFQDYMKNTLHLELK